MSGLNDESLIQEFLDESREHLDAIEPDLLALEQQGKSVSDETINSIFRAIHSIKGASGFFGFEALKSFSHIMESVLMMIRDKKIEPEPDTIDVLLRGVDRLSEMVNDITHSDSVDVSGEEDQLEAIMNGGAPQLSPPPDTQPAQAPSEGVCSDHPFFNLSLPEVAHAKAQGQYLYEVTLFWQDDLINAGRTVDELMALCGSLGSLLQSSVPFEQLKLLSGADETPETVQWLFTSVIEQDLIPAALQLPENRVRDLEKQSAKDFQDPSGSQNTEDDVQANQTSQPEAASESVNPASEELVASKSASAAGKNESIRVKVDLLNRLMNLAGEMVLLRNQLNQKLENESDRVDGLATVLQNINLTTTELQEHIMQTRMQPIGNVFSKFHRVVRDIARALDKDINITISGDEVELDKSIVETLSDPLTHLIRNSCDHGIESREERKARGKNPTGQVALNAFQEGGQIIISIQDDGKGIDAEQLAQKAVKKGIYTQEEISRLSTKEKVNLIFHPGFSMAAQVSDISGRGVGMDVVKTNIEKIGGSINVETEVGMGTIIYLHLPLTLAIIPSLLVGVDSFSFAIPQINVVELIRVKAQDAAQQLERIGNASVLKLRGRLLPLLRLADVLGIQRYYTDPETGERLPEQRHNIVDRRNPGSPSHPEMMDNPSRFNPRTQTDRRDESMGDFNVVVLKLGGKQYGLIVDEVFNLEEIVVKPLSSYLNDCQCFAGSTIMGDGQVSMILDVTGIANFSKLDFSNVEKEEENRNEASSNADANLQAYDVILFSNGEANNPQADQFAVDLSSVMRLEKFKLSDIQMVGQRECLTYQGRSLPLIRLENHIPLNPVTHQSDEAYLIIPKAARGRVAIVANHIVDVDSVQITLEESFIQHPGVRGLAVIHNRITTFINPEGFIAEVGLASVARQLAPVESNTPLAHIS